MEELEWNRGELKPSVKRHCSLATLLGGAGRAVNSLDFCRPRLSPVAAFISGVRTFFTMEGGVREFANFTLPTLKTFLEARSQNVSTNKQ